MSQTEKSFILPESMRDELLAYLKGQPYALVAKGIAKLEGLQTVTLVQQAPVSAPDLSIVPPQTGA